MGRTRTAAAAGLLVVEAGLATLSGLLHYALTSEYGDVTAPAHEVVLSGVAIGTSGLALVIVGSLGVAAALTTPRRWVRLTALAIPLLLVVGTFAVTPLALRQKLATQYSDTPQCEAGDDLPAGPGSRAARQSQRAFDSVDHVGHFGGGGGSGVGGCDRAFVLTEDVDVLAHYRGALSAAGWQVVEDERDHLRAERDDMALEVTVCDGGGVLWAGTLRDRNRAGCGERS